MFTESPRFWVDISRGSAGGPTFNSLVVQLDNGNEQIFARWQYPLHEYDVSFGVKTQADLDLVRQLFWIKKGQAGGFRYKDWADFTVDHTRGQLVYVSPGVYQAVKLYSYGTETALRTLKKPNADTAQEVKRNGTLTAAVTWDNTTGLVTFTADATSAASSITVGATTTVVLAANLSLAAGGQLTLSGFAGADAALVNNIAHVIASVTGTGPYTFTLNTNTAGKTITLGSGLGSKYPQTADTLSIATSFDVPVRFNIDKMLPSIDDYNVTTWGQIALVEQRTPA